jgi:hypothetical protein
LKKAIGLVGINVLVNTPMHLKIRKLWYSESKPEYSRPDATDDEQQCGPTLQCAGGHSESPCKIREERKRKKEREKERERKKKKEERKEERKKERKKRKKERRKEGKKEGRKEERRKKKEDHQCNPHLQVFILECLDRAGQLVGLRKILLHGHKTV